MGWEGGAAPSTKCTLQQANKSTHIHCITAERAKPKTLFIHAVLLILHSLSNED